MGSNNNLDQNIIKEMEEEISKKGQRRIGQAPEIDNVGASSCTEQQETAMKIEEGITVSDGLYGLEMEQGMGLGLGLDEGGEDSLLLDPLVDLPEEEPKVELPGEELNDDFWEDLVNDGVGEKASGSCMAEQGRNGDQMSLFADKMGYLSSNSPRKW